MDPQNLTSPIPNAQAPQNQAPDLAALIAPPGQAPTDQTPQGLPQAQPTPQEQVDPRLVLISQALEREQQRATALEAQQEQYEAQRINDWFTQLPEEQKPFGQWAVGAIQQNKSKDRTIADLTRQVQELQQTFLPYVKNDAYSHLSQQYGVPRQMLEAYSQSPQEARAIALAVQALQKEQAFKQRQATNLDAVGTPSMAASSASGKEAIEEKFRGTGRLEDKLRALSQAGLR